MAELTSELFLGTSSWSEKSWIGAFYPDNIRPSEMLAYYSRHFNSVEADVTYYRIPSAGMIRNWKQQIPDHFRLSAKFPRSIVHAGEGREPDPEKILVWERVAGETESFLNAMSLLGGRCGPLVLQFPYFNKKVFPDQAVFTDRLNSYLEKIIPYQFKLGVELRNPGWITPDLCAMLQTRNTCLVFADIPYMPGPGHIGKNPGLITAGFAYIRLIGDRKAVEETASGFNRIVIDRSAALQEWAGLIPEFLSGMKEIFVYANNHYAGYGIDTIRMLAGLIDAG